MGFYLLGKTKMGTPSLPLDYQIKHSSSLKKKPCLILLHGYGSNEEDLFSFATYLPAEYTIISFRAPIALDMGGYAWNNIYFDDSGDKNIIIQEAKDSLELIKESIRLSITYFNLDDKDISLIGFSQGCILSWAMIINHPNLIRRAVALSGCIVTKLINTPLEKVSQLLMFNSHGILDQMISVEKARQSINLIKKNNPKITYKEYNEGHEINQENFSDFLNWIKTTSL